jgi:membrane associated rhomboid family serine protease
MLFPFRDDNPTRRPPVLTVAIIGVNIVVFLYQMVLPERTGEAFVYAFGMIPAVLFGAAQLPPELAVLPPWATVFTSMFLHGSVMHIAGNMLFLWVFGNNVEDSMGHGRFIVFYLLCGIAAAMTQGLSDPTSEIPMIGASGAISGVLGAYLVLHPRAHVDSLLFLGIFAQVIRLPAMIVLGLWFGLQLLNALLVHGQGEGGVAFLAHIGGFIAGMVLVPLFREKNMPLFGGPAQGRRLEFRRRPNQRGPWG